MNGGIRAMCAGSLPASKSKEMDFEKMLSPVLTAEERAYIHSLPSTAGHVQIALDNLDSLLRAPASQIVQRKNPLSR